MQRMMRVVAHDALTPIPLARSCDCDWGFTNIPSTQGFEIKVACEMRNAKDKNMNGACIITYNAAMGKTSNATTLWQHA